MTSFNSYGDTRKRARHGYGTEVSIQRCDDLDQAALEAAGRFSHPIALDLACGQGGQTLRLLQAGATQVVALDVMPYGHEISLNAAKAGLDPSKITFIQSDVRDLKRSLPQDAAFDIICYQRALHYLRYAEAKEVLTDLKSFAKQPAALFVSASGLEGEEGKFYPHAHLPVEERFAELLEPMRTQQNALHPMCLYRVSDMCILLEDAGWKVHNIHTSPFGTIKAAATFEGPAKPEQRLGQSAPSIKAPNSGPWHS